MAGDKRVKGGKQGGGRCPGGLKSRGADDFRELPVRRAAGEGKWVGTLRRCPSFSKSSS